VTPVIDASALAIITCALIASSFVDLKRRIIPNELVILVAVCGLGACLSTRPSDAALSLLVAGGVFFALAWCCRRNWLGGGDVKLMTALTLAVPASEVGALLVAISVAGAILCCAYLTARLALTTFRLVPAGPAPAAADAPLLAWVHAESARIMEGRSVPYALAIFGGFVYHAF
jgi:prepilin peptidase CpaA